jgi:ABC-type branched-subunit amino acid transport system substrate-binding protein
MTLNNRAALFLLALLSLPPFWGTANLAHAGRELTIGCVLPLSGDQADVGAQALKGIQLAFSAKSQFVDKAGLKLVLKDSGGNAESIAVAMNELAADATVLGVVGMFAPAQLRPALSNGGYNLAIIAPSVGAKPELTQNEKSRLFQIELTNSGQVDTLVEIAMKKLNLRTFAVLHPDSQYGAELSGLFIEAVKKNGGTITVVEKYDPSQTDFKAQMTALGGMDDHHLRQAIYTYAKEHPDKSIEELNAALHTIYRKGLSYPRITKTKGLPLSKNNFSFEMKVGYDAIFLPAGYEQAGLILPALAFYNIADMLVLGTDMMLSPEFVTIGGKYAENALFTGEFYPSAAENGVKTFTSNYKNAVGENPDVVAARYYDAMMMTLSLVENGGVGDRRKMLAALNGLTTYGGVSGMVRRLPDGGLEKIPLVFTVEKGKIIEYQPPAPPEKQR